MSDRARYITHAITFDMEGKTQGDYDDFERHLTQLEVDFPGAMVLGTDWTHSWPTYRIHETRKAKARKESETA
jgi:hypothetical protein